MTEFRSLKDLVSYIEEYENQHFIQLWKRDTRNIETMKKVCPHKLINCNAELKYYSITFACSRGGRKFKTTSSGLRNSFTTKNDCPMNIKIKLSSDGQKLQIASLNENHNHNIDKDTFHLLPKQRKLDSEDKNEADNLLQLKCNKKLFQAYLLKTGMHAVLHGFPNPVKDTLRFNTWLHSIGSDILGLENAHKFKYHRVCHRHFQDKYVCRYNRLSNIAVPTLYLQDLETVVCEQVPPSTSQSTEQNLESKSKVSAEQIRILCNFFEENPEVLRGHKRTPKCMQEVQMKWKNITPHLNAVGPPRDHWSWAKYLCDMKAKLKRKSIKWRKSCDGKDPIMCNTNDYNEIRLRMLQVLRKDVSSSQESQDSHTSDLETEDDNNDQNKGENYEIEILPDVKPKLECLEQNSQDINDTPPPDLQSRQLVFQDEFDYFGKNVAEQLRTLPLSVALETQEILLSVLKKQRLKVLQDPLHHN